MTKVGIRANWSGVYAGDRPRDILGLTQDQEAKISQFIGFTGKDQAGNPTTKFILVFNGTSNPTLTDFAATPIGTIIETPYLASTSHYIHQAKSTPAVVGDWKKVSATTVT